MYVMKFPSDKALWTPKMPFHRPVYHMHRDFQAKTETVYAIMADNVVAFLPHRPDHGAEVSFLEGKTGIHGFVVARFHGARIMGLDENMNADIPGFMFTLKYHDAKTGWRLKDE